MKWYITVSTRLKSTVVDTAKKYRTDSACTLFLLILENKIPEYAYFGQMQMLSALFDRIKSLDTVGSGQVEKTAMYTMLHENFSAKSDRNYYEIIEVCTYSHTKGIGQNATWSKRAV